MSWKIEQNRNGSWFWKYVFLGLTLDKGGPFNSREDAERDAWRNGWTADILYA